MAGTLPSSWGVHGSFPALSNLTLANNNLSGSLPVSWGLNPQRVPRFKHLQWLALLPGAMLSAVPVMRAAQSSMLRRPGSRTHADGHYSVRSGCSIRGNGVCRVAAGACIVSQASHSCALGEAVLLSERQAVQANEDGT